MQRRCVTFTAGLGLLTGLLALPSSAAANGQSTHLWITADARSHVPEGPLADFLADPAIDRMLRNGTMFPDGGYPLGDPYAEIAHWEPFQTLYLDWILATYDPPYTGEAAEHLAFLFGMASHGMADQVFDSLYGERVKLYDGAFGDFDTASDIIMMSYFDPMMAPSDWVPYALFDQLYDEFGYDVDPAVMMDGQNLLRIAVNSVAIFSQMPETVAEQAAPFPWGSQHLLDETVPGAPPCEGEIIARYWRVLWALAHEQVLPGPVMATIPADGAADHPTDSSTLESWVSVAFSRGLETGPLTAASFHVAPDAEPEAEVPITIWHYYGQDAHIVHLRPQADLAPNTIYRITVDPGILTIHGDALDGFEFRFSTGAVGPEPIVPEWPADHDPNPDPGDGDGDPSTGDGDGDPSTGDGDGDPSTGDGDDDPSSGESGTGDPGIDEGAGCSCASASVSSPGPAALLLLPVVFGLTSSARRRRSQTGAGRSARSR